MNDINKKQNENYQLELLFVQRYLYSCAKIIFVCRTITALTLAIVGPVFIAYHNKWSACTALLVIGYLFLDNFVLQKIELNKKETAAKIQELFDTKVFEIDWNNVGVGDIPDRDIITSIISKNKNNDYQSLQLNNWYDASISNIDLSIARLICQNSNIGWDLNLRRRYLIFLYVISILTIISLFVTAINLNLTLIEFILGVLIPTLPLMELTIKQINEHGLNNINSNRLKKILSSELHQITNNIPIANSEFKTRIFQDQIYRYRSTCPVVFDWFYWFFKDTQEDQMQLSVKDKVEEILN